MDNVDSVFADLEKVCTDSLNDMREAHGTEVTTTVKEMKTILLKHKQLLKAQDLVYFGLKKIAPSKTEMLQTRNALVKMSKLWKELGCSKTPKAHLLFDHAADEQVRWGGLGDKLEDPLEKRHQIQMSLMSVLKRIPDDAKRLEAQNKREWMISNPLATNILHNIYSRDIRTSSTTAKGKAKGLTGTARRHTVSSEVSEEKKVKKRNTRTKMRKSLSATARWRTD